MVLWSLELCVMVRIVFFVGSILAQDSQILLTSKKLAENSKAIFGKFKHIKKIYAINLEEYDYSTFTNFRWTICKVWKLCTMSYFPMKINLLKIAVFELSPLNHHWLCNNWDIGGKNGEKIMIVLTQAK